MKDLVEKLENRERINKKIVVEDKIKTII